MKLYLIAILLMTTTVIEAQNKTSVLVLGTLHQFHSRDKNFTFSDIVKIMDTFKPDVICVEIREEEFRKKLYLPEMTLAVIYGISKGLKIYPVDWWSGNVNKNARSERDSLVGLKEYKALMKESSKKEKQSKIITDFENNHGKKFSNLLQKPYTFFNGKEYNDYIRESYRISLETFGDSPMNLYWESRNLKMYSLIEDAILQNEHKNIIVLTGCEHKYFFDDTLANRNDIHLVSLNSLLPLKEDAENKSVNNHLQKGNDSLYFFPGYPTDKESYFLTKLIPLLHGSEMDAKPELIPETNKNKASLILETWHKENPESINYRFEQGWYCFVTKDYKKAIDIFEKMDIEIDSLIAKKQKLGLQENAMYLNFLTNRTLGFCYDILGLRSKAVSQYKKGIEKIKNSQELPGLKKTIMIKYLFKNYKRKPFKSW